MKPAAMKTIWKFEMPPSWEISMPAGAEFLSIGEQHNKVCLWMLVDPEATDEIRRFAVFGTGHPVPDIPLRFLGSVQLFDGDLVFHAFERANEK